MCLDLDGRGPMMGLARERGASGPGGLKTQRAQVHRQSDWVQCPMRIHVVPQASTLRRRDLSGWTTVVIDALRASSTIAQALASGCLRVIPVVSIAEARTRRQALGEEPALLGGERRGLKIPGFDLGNSPREYTAEAVAGRSIVMTTTNGTRALRASRHAGETLVGAFLNMTAVVRHLASRDQDVVLVPVGRTNAPVLDDVVCAGMYVDRLMEQAKATANGGAQLVRMAYLGYRGRIEDALRDSASGQALIQAGLQEDLPYSAQVGVLDVVPRLDADEIRVDGPRGS